jgi:hypothetical protein
VRPRKIHEICNVLIQPECICVYTWRFNSSENVLELIPYEMDGSGEGERENLREINDDV